MTKEEEKYLIAKEAYYAGNPIISDEEFDKLENELSNINSKMINIVGFNINSSKQKFAHPSRMLSLAKIKAKINSNPPYEDFLKWLEKIKVFEFTVEPKYDGNAVNVVYKNGKLYKALTRGDGDAGIDITHILQYHVPTKIDDIRLIEVRGEMLIKKDIFNNKYSHYKNPRNYVAGVLHRDDLLIEDVNDLSFIPFEVKIHSESKFFYAETHNWLLLNNFNEMSKVFTIKFDKDVKKQFCNIFDTMLDYRDNESNYLLDGFVFKVLSSKDRIRLGENSHDPEWGLAVKFEPKGIIAIIDHIEWNLSRKSELIPIGILEPIELDGSTIKRVSLYNYRFCLEHFKNGVHGAEVELVKAGDIIPQVLKVVTEPYSNDSWIPKKCPKCNGKIEIKDVHIICVNPECSGANIKKFVFGASQLGMEHFGTKTLEKFYEAGIKNPIHIFSIDKDFMIKNGFGDGRSTQRLLEQVSAVSEISLECVFLTLGIDNLGTTIAKQLAKWYAKTGDFDGKGLQKDIIEDFINKGKSYKLLVDSLNYLNKIGKKVIIPKKNDLNIKYIEATGSPKSAGFLTKEEFFKYASRFGFENDSLSKNSQYLITDTYTSTSGKMSKANKLGIEIITFEDFCKKYN